jgi:hypothetical protein
MEITLVKAHDHTLLKCVRHDGTHTACQLGPSFPHHDLSHFVVESYYRLASGFFGLISRGMSIQELSDNTIIPTLGKELMLSEILTRNLQGVNSGSVEPSQFAEVVQSEMESLDLDFPFTVNEGEAVELANRYNILLNQWKSLRITESMSIHFNIDQ